MTFSSEHLKLPDGALLPLSSLGNQPASGREPRMGNVNMTVATEPARARAVLSNEDFKLLQEAVVYYIKSHEDDPISSKYSNLYHRLGSAIRR
jgi:hypothetical protein